jgi:hypothetical protein
MDQQSDINWAEHDFYPVVPSFPCRGQVSVLDLTGNHKESIEEQMLTPPYSIGKYDENRNIYKTDLFSDGRSLHVGLGKSRKNNIIYIFYAPFLIVDSIRACIIYIYMYCSLAPTIADMGGPVGTEVCSFMEGTIHSAGYNAEAGDYGNVVITEHELLNGVRLWALFGHLDNQSSSQWKKGDIVQRGQCIGRFGDMSENGGWFPHVHFQLSLHEPATHDMPGAVLVSEREAALVSYPDPQHITGRFYD